MADISLDSTEQQPSISLDTGVSSPNLSVDQVNVRATKAHMAIKDIMPDISFQDIHDAITTGKESQLRSRAAAVVDQNKINQLWGTVNDSVQKGTQLNPSDVQKAAAFAGEKTNPDTVLESRYALNYMKFLNWSMNDPDKSTMYKDALQHIPEIANSTVNSAQSLVAHNELINRYKQDNEAATQQQSYLGYGFDWAKGFAVPFYNQAIASEHFFNLFGSDLQTQSQEFYTMNVDEANQWLKQNYERISSHSLQLAGEWLDALLGQSSGEKLLNNIGTLVDTSILAGPVAKLAGLSNAVTSASRNMVKGTAAVAEVGPARAAAAAAGDLAKAGEIGAAEKVSKILTGHEDPFKDLDSELPSIVKINKVEDAGNFGQENANRLEEQVNKNSVAVLRYIRDHPQIERTPDLVWTSDMMAKLKNFVKDQYRYDNILDIGKPYKDVFGHWQVPIRLGQTDATYWDMKSTAENWLSMKGIKDAQLMKEYTYIPADPNFGLPYVDLTGTGRTDRRVMPLSEVDGPVYAEIVRPVDETAPFIRDTLASTEYSKTKKGVVNSIIGWARTPEETQAPAELANRKIIDNAPAVLKQQFRDIAKPLTRLNKSERLNLDRIWEDQTKTGEWAKNPLELEGMYQQAGFGLPSDREVKAYFAYKQAKLLQRTYERIADYKEAVRAGNLSVRIRMEDIDGNPIYSDFFNARPISSVSKGKGGIYVTGVRPGSDSVFNDGTALPKNLKLNKSIKTAGYKAYVIDDPDSHPLNGFGKVSKRHGNRPVYIVGPNIEERELTFNRQKPRSETPRRIEHPFVLSQADIYREGNTNWYNGPKVVAAHDNRATLEDFAKDMNTVRDHVANNRLAEAEQHTREHLPIAWDELIKNFRPGRDPITGKFISSVFSKTEPFLVHASDKDLLDISGNGIAERNSLGNRVFKNTSIEGSPRNQRMYNLLKERDVQDIFSIKNTGTHDNPIWDLAPVRYVDPLTTMNRAFSNVVNSVFMNDYKISAIEHWIEEGRKTDIFSKEVRDAPQWYFRNPPFKAGLDPIVKRQFELTKFQIEQFLGVPSKLDQTLQSWSQHLADSIYSKWNPDKYGPIVRSALLTPSWALAHATDAVNFVRSFTFNAMMGLFNPVHLFLWTMNYSNIFGIAGPLRAGQGTLGALLHQMSRFNKNPQVLDYLDKMAFRMGLFKPGEWREANEAADRYGWGLGRRELSFQPHELNPKVFKSGFNQFIDAGQIFLRGADRNLQYGAWYTAYKEYREANKSLGLLTNADWQKVLTRADLLSGNMANSSRSALQNGVLGFPTQFMSYQLRLWELFTGKRLTSVEKARLLTTYGLLFGLPASAGLMSGPIPLGESIRQAALEHGYVTGDGFGITTAMEGFLGQLSHLVSGTYLDVGKRFGDYGIDLMRDKTIWDMIGGASYSEFSNILSSTNGFWHMVQSFMSGTDKFQPTPQDLVDVAQNAQTVAIGNRMLIALNTGQWLSRNGAILDKDLSPQRAIIQSLLGLTSEDQQDIYTKDASLKDYEASWQKAEAEATKNYRLGIQAQVNNDPEQARTYFNRARIILDWAQLPQERWKDWMRKASNNYESIIDKSNWDYYMVGKNVSMGQGTSRGETFSRLRNMPNG